MVLGDSLGTDRATDMEEDGSSSPSSFGSQDKRPEEAIGMGLGSEGDGGTGDGGRK